MLVDGVWYFVALALVNCLNMLFYRVTPPGLDQIQVPLIVLRLRLSVNHFAIPDRRV
jgi:hypothetical protein